MKIICFEQYKTKKEGKFQSIKNEIDTLENRLKNNFFSYYHHISTNKKTMRIADSKGGFRVPIFIEENILLLIDIVLKQDIDKNEKKYYDEIFSKENIEIYKKFILENKTAEKLEKYEEIKNIEFSYHPSEYIHETKKITKKFQTYDEKELKKQFEFLENIDNNNEKHSKYKNIYKLSNTIFYRKIGDRLLLIDANDDLSKIDKIENFNEIQVIKAYPKDILLDDYQNWIDFVVKNEDGNIALSDEEIEILEHSLKKQKFPLLINGRAGSGKSTIIQYIFAEYLVQFIKENKKENFESYPIYLTYSEFLKEKAIQKVTNIILTKPHLREFFKIQNRDKIEKTISFYFKSFEDKFLEDLVNEDFDNDKKVDFVKFKNKIFSNLRAKKEISVELAWYLIRNIFKLNKEYSKDIGVTKKEYKNGEEIYQSYKNYLVKYNFYDDLDVINKVVPNIRFCGVFCDEAQDFTAKEFELLEKLTISNAPMVFAGDPTQTINPTGFSFKDLKTFLYQKNNDIKESYKELKYNYRSYKNIINFSNTIQFTRGVLFIDKKDSKNNKIYPQKSWSDNLGDVYFFDIKSKDLIDFLNKQKNAYDLILPRESNTFIKNKKIYTPITSKGLEFEFVVVKGFGDYFLEEFDESIEKLLQRKQANFKYEHFFNNLYVAITRAKEKLFIIDSLNSYENFWKKLDRGNLFQQYKDINKDIQDSDIKLLMNLEKGNELVIFDKDYTKQKIERLKDILFERIFQEEDKNSLLNEVNEIFTEIKENHLENLFLGFKYQFEKNYQKSLDYFIKFLYIQKEMKFQKYTFVILWDNFVELKLNEEELEYLKYYENEEKIKFLKLFYKQDYFTMLESFDIFSDEYKRFLEFMKNYIQKNKNRLKIENLKRVYDLEFLQEEELLEILKQKKKIYEIKKVLKLFENEIKNYNDNLFCEMKIKVENNIECLLKLNKIDEIKTLLKNQKISLNEILKFDIKNITLLKYITDEFLKTNQFLSFRIFESDEVLNYLIQKINYLKRNLKNESLFHFLTKKLDIENEQNIKLFSKIVEVEKLLDFYDKQTGKTLFKFIQLNLDNEIIKIKYTIQNKDLIKKFKNYKEIENKNIDEIFEFLTPKNGLNNKNISKKLLEIQKFINSNYSKFSDETIQELFNTICGMKEEVENIKKDYYKKTIFKN